MAKRQTKAQRVSEYSVHGHEPELSGLISQAQLINALNWYNRFYDEDKSPKWVLEYMVSSGKFTADQIERYKQASNQASNQSVTISSVARLLSRGCIFANDLDHRLHKIIDTVPKNARPAVRFTSSYNHAIACADDLLDQFYNNNYVIDKLSNKIDNITKNATQKEIASAVAQYRDLLAEISSREIASEAYDHLSTKQIGQYQKFVRAIIDRLTNSKAEAAVVRQKTRKPRKKKVKSAKALVAKCNVLVADKKLGLVSVSPEKIVESTVVWTYNTKTRKLAKYVGADEGLLTVSRSSIRNFSESESVMKTVRKPEKIADALKTNSKGQLAKLFSTIKSKARVPSGRLNNQTLIVRTFK